MTEGQVITLLASLGGIAVAALAFWRWIESKINAVGTKAEAAAAAMHLLAVQLADYKTHVAETYVSKQGLREFRDEVMAGVRELKGSVSGLHERIDRIIDAKHTPP